MVRYHLDEHVPAAIAVGLRQRGIDVTTSVEAGLLGADDTDHLRYATAQSRVLVSHVPATLLTLVSLTVTRRNTPSASCCACLCCFINVRKASR